MDRTAMADTPRNSAADRIKNSTDDSILKSYRECLWAMGRPSIPCAQPAGERKDKGVVPTASPPCGAEIPGEAAPPDVESLNLSNLLIMPFFMPSLNRPEALSRSVVKRHQIFRDHARKRLRE
jgi:hypothetical protein